jgi:hypothetical protein
MYRPFLLTLEVPKRNSEPGPIYNYGGPILEVHPENSEMVTGIVVPFYLCVLMKQKYHHFLPFHIICTYFFFILTKEIIIPFSLLRSRILINFFNKFHI